MGQKVGSVFKDGFEGVLGGLYDEMGNTENEEK